jgi:hypothetical protein
VILNSDRTQAISTLGWVDKGAVWVFAAGKLSPRRVKLSDAKYLSLKDGSEDFFAVLHHWDGDRLEISAHSHSEPGRVISRLALQAPKIDHADPTIFLEGELSVWARLPKAFTAYAFGDYRLLLTTHLPDVAVQVFAWFDNSYDKGYQGVIDVTEVPGTHLLIVAIQRDSAPALYDPQRKQLLRKLKLADRCGNPEFRYHAAANEFWATDYDFLVKLDGKNLMPIKAAQLQDAVSGTRQFIGNFCFNRDASLCWVARPFSGDVLALETDSMRQVHRIALGGQPLDIGILADDTIVARDWKTGAPASGKH